MASAKDIEMRVDGGGVFVWKKEWPTPIRKARSTPMMTPEQRASLAESIRRKGQLHPCQLSHDGDRLIDGRNRYGACMEAGIEPKIEYLPDGTNEADIVEAANEQRVHLLAGQRVALRMLNGPARATQEQIASYVGCAQSLVSMVRTGAEMLVSDGEEPNLKAALQEIAWGRYKESDLRQRRNERKKREKTATKDEAVANNVNQAGIKFLRSLEAAPDKDSFLDGALRIASLAVEHSLEADQVYRLVNGTVIPGTDED